MTDYSDATANRKLSFPEGASFSTATVAPKVVDSATRSSSTSSLSKADPDADAEGEPDDLDADADGIEDDNDMDYSYEQPDADAIGEADHDASDGAENEGHDDDSGGESGGEMELDENASSPPPSPPSRLSDQLNQHDPESNKKPLVLKLKLATQSTSLNGSPSAPPKRKYIKKTPVSKFSSGQSRPANESKGVRDTDEEDDELAEDVLGSDNHSDDDANGDQTGPDQAWDDSEENSESDGAIRTGGQLTVRQRAKEYGEAVADLQSLPMSEGKKKKELTEADRAIEKAEKSRKRKHQNEKKLEDEKTETINRLLKGQAGKAGKVSACKTGGALDNNEEGTQQAMQPPACPPLPTTIREISSIRSGEYVTSLSIPSSVLQDYQDDLSFNLSPTIVYPPHVRPPPKTWKLVNGMRVN